MKTKYCPKCKKNLLLENFTTDSRTSTGLSSWCKDCSAKNSKTWYYLNKDKISEKRRMEYKLNPKKYIKTKTEYYFKNKDKISKQRKEKRLKSRYNLTIEEFNQILESQNYKCAICNKESNLTLHVDHDHKTGKVRGFLCYRCNILLGYAKDNINRLINAIKYLKENENGNK